MYTQVNGLVLSTSISAEADKVVTLYTRELGKITCVAPGAKKITARLAGATEPITESEFIVYQSRHSVRPKITGARMVNSFGAFSREWRRAVLAYSCAELCSVMTPYHAEHVQKYDLLRRSWQLLEKASHPRRVLIAYALRFIRLSGYNFVDYLKRESYRCPPDQLQCIVRLGALSGQEIDALALEDLPEEQEQRILWFITWYLEHHIQVRLRTKRLWGYAVSAALPESVQPAYKEICT